MNSIEEYDVLKTKVLKYVLFKKRTEREVRQKFSENAGNLLEDVIEYLKQEKYIDDENYIVRSVNEYINLKNLSLKELKYKLLTKGISKDLIENYIFNNREDLLEYEFKSATNILVKKENLLPKEEIINYLRKKGYLEETIKNI
jgi:regulatory protein